MNEKNKAINIAEEWDKADEGLKAAKILLDENLPGEAVTRIYYAAFHGVRALLFSEGLEAKTHQGVAQLFNLHFLKTEKIDVAYAHVLRETQKEREDADYVVGSVFAPEKVKERLDEVKDFLNVVKGMLQKSGYLS